MRVLNCGVRLLGIAILLAAVGVNTLEAADPRLRRTDLLEFIDENGAVAPVTSVREWEKRRLSILGAMQEVMGPLPGESKRCPLDVQIVGEADFGDYVRRCVTYVSEPGCRVPAYLLVPKRALSGAVEVPGILCLHQTHPLGHDAVVGLGNSPNDEYAVELVERGYVCLAPAYPLLANYHPDLRTLSYQSGTMKAIWDNTRGLDLLESLPYVQKSGFGAIGHSLGGHNSVYTAAFDDRIKVIVSSCGLDSYRDYMNGEIKGWTSERYMPRLLDYSLADIPFDFHEIIGLLAPRVCFLSAPIGDTNFQWWSVDNIARAAAPVYALYGKTEHLSVEHPECGHLFSREMREAAFRLFDEHLKN